MTLLDIPAILIPHVNNEDLHLPWHSAYSYAYYRARTVDSSGHDCHSENNKVYYKCLAEANYFGKELSGNIDFLLKVMRTSQVHHQLRFCFFP